jgi:hypothetical protein
VADQETLFADVVIRSYSQGDSNPLMTHEWYE